MRKTAVVFVMMGAAAMVMLWPGIHRAEADGRPLADSAVLAPDPADTIRFSFVDNQGVLGTFVINASYPPTCTETWCSYPLEALVEFDYLDFVITCFNIGLVGDESKFLFCFHVVGPSTSFNFDFEGRGLFDSLTTAPEDYVFLHGLVYAEPHGTRTFPDFVVGTFDTLPTVDSMPKIVRQPGTIWPCEGAYVGTSVYAEGPNLTYQWYLNDTLVTGVTVSRLMFSPATFADDGSTIFVIVSNSSGADTSQIVTVNVQPRSACAPRLISEPADQCICENDDAGFSVDYLSSYGTNVRWYVNGHRLQDETRDTLMIPGVQLEDDGSEIQAIVSNVMEADTSRVATLTVAPADECHRLCSTLARPQRVVLSRRGMESNDTRTALYNLQGKSLAAGALSAWSASACGCYVARVSGTSRFIVQLREGPIR